MMMSGGLIQPIPTTNYTDYLITRPGLLNYFAVKGYGEIAHRNRPPAQ
jgi:hypothetical protein